MDDPDENALQDTLAGMQAQLESELSTLGGLVGRFRGLDAQEGEDLARNTLRAYDAVADVVRMVRELRGEAVDEELPRRACAGRAGLHAPVPAVEASARDFFANEPGEDD